MKVSEFAKAMEVNVETIRYYHRIGLLSLPASTASYRCYSSEHVNKMKFIQKAKSAGFSLQDINALSCMHTVNDKAKIRRMSEEKMQGLEDKIAQLQSAKRFLSSLVSACKNSNEKACPILQTLRSDET